MSWFTLLGFLLLATLTVAVILWTWSSLKDIFSNHPRDYSESTYYWICCIMLFLGLGFILVFLLELLGWSGQLLKQIMELLAKALIF